MLVRKENSAKICVNLAKSKWERKYLEKEVNCWQISAKMRKKGALEK